MTSLSSGLGASALDPDRLEKAKRAYVTRRADLSLAKQLLTGPRKPIAGDLLLARVAEVSPRNRIELTDGRRAHLFLGDEIVVAYGNRYAPDQYEALVPENLDACELVAAGGLASRVVRRHDAMAKPSTIVPIGLLADGKGQRLNLADFGLPVLQALPPRLPRIIAVAGTSMNAGKTTACTCLIRGLRDAGLSVNALKITGTGAGGDLWQMKDAGAGMALDFTDAGHASTYRIGRSELIACFLELVAHGASTAPDAIVLEVADGLLQAETATLLRSLEFRSVVNVVLFAAGDALSAESGVRWLREEQLPVRLLSGLMSASPLAMAEAESATGLPVLTMAQLSRGETLVPLLFESGADDRGAMNPESNHALAQRTVG
ncbi:MAG: DUF1611 domain-containing protein [Gammaproteobacteria bacterium]|nr:DUF1611 domain-containing protein [Gammaproteobacteria bacterium]